MSQTTGNVSVPSTTPSTTTSSGALVIGNGISGGLGVGGAVNVGGAVTTSSSIYVPSDQVYYQGVSNSTGTFRRLGQGLSTLHLGSYGGASFANVSNGASGVLVEFIKTRGTAVGDFAAAQNGDELGALNWRVGNGTSLSDCSLITAYVDGVPSGANVPSNLVFKVRPNTGAADTALTIASTKAATFAGAVTSTGNFFQGASGSGIFITGRSIYPDAANSLVTVYGGNDATTWFKIYGNTHATKASQAEITATTTTFSGDVGLSTAGKTISIKSGTNAAAGTVTLVGGSATITSTAIDVNTVIVMSVKTSGGTIGDHTPSVKVNAGNAVITGSSSDTSTYNWIALKVN
jgi:hypothetical protein